MNEQTEIIVRGVPLAETVQTYDDRIMAWVHDDGRIFIGALAEANYECDLSEHITGNFLFHPQFRPASTVYNCNEVNRHHINDFFCKTVKTPVPDWAYRKLDAFDHGVCCIYESGSGTQCKWDISRYVGVWYLSKDTIQHFETALLQEARAKCKVEGKFISDEDLLYDIAQRYFEDDLKWKNAVSYYCVNIIEFSPNGEERESYWTGSYVHEDMLDSFADLFYDNLIYFVGLKMTMARDEFIAFVTDAPDVIVV